eukprot:CAMPEP_0169145050 /NCGR_PEP_ID=MMETSP1015-20121227/46667_1 /TAXON_ID=342587 /ORGANISM="Karlodinium micrum, Strain CCMP2283" /LENGTH=111 /DNA_ID=CAMNT_0009212539 /DNA_START=391 /DNA_END=727 /DNA_ORIENTATION=-
MPHYIFAITDRSAEQLPVKPTTSEFIPTSARNLSPSRYKRRQTLRKLLYLGTANCLQISRANAANAVLSGTPPLKCSLSTAFILSGARTHDTFAKLSMTCTGWQGCSAWTA